MADRSPALRARFDRAGMVLSGACAVHCVAWVVFATVFGIGGDALGSPVIHRVGLALALIVGIVALGLGIRRHGRRGPLLVGAAGLVLMALALLVPHGTGEAILTVSGVALLALAHRRNLHAAH